MLRIAELLPTHADLRDTDQISRMIEHVRKGGRFNLAELQRHLNETGEGHLQLIQIARFEDEALYIRDGHHRALSIHKAGRDFLHEDEYEISSWVYSDFMEANIEAGWMTPFDPRLEIRKSDLKEWKEAVRAEISSRELDKNDLQRIRSFIRRNRDRFALPRGNVRHIEDLVCEITHILRE